MRRRRMSAGGHCACMLLSVDTARPFAVLTRAALGGGRRPASGEGDDEWDECKKLVLSLGLVDLLSRSTSAVSVPRRPRRLHCESLPVAHALPAGSEDSLPPSEHPAGEATVDVEQAKGVTPPPVSSSYGARASSPRCASSRPPPPPARRRQRAPTVALDQRIEELAGAVAALEARGAGERGGGGGGAQGEEGGGDDDGAAGRERGGCVRRRSGGARAAERLRRGRRRRERERRTAAS